MPGRILIVDDEPAVRRTLQRALERAGHETLSAGTGEEASQVLATESGIDLILLDLRMPGMSGRTFYQMVLGQWPHLARRLVIMSGDPEAEDHASWLAVHDLPVLTKPFSVAEVLQTVAAFLCDDRREADGRGS